MKKELVMDSLRIRYEFWLPKKLFALKASGQVTVIPEALHLELYGQGSSPAAPPRTAHGALQTKAYGRLLDWHKQKSCSSPRLGT